jgi:hypothetical protein
VQQTDSGLAVVTAHLDELIQYPALLLLHRFQVTPSHCFGVLLYAASGHIASIFGNTSYEATIPTSVTVIMSQFAALTTHQHSDIRFLPTDYISKAV